MTNRTAETSTTHATTTTLSPTAVLGRGPTPLTDPEAAMVAAAGGPASGGVGGGGTWLRVPSASL